MDNDQIDVDAPLSIAFNFHKKLRQKKLKRNVQVSSSMAALGGVVEHRSSAPEASHQDSIPIPLGEEQASIPLPLPLGEEQASTPLPLGEEQADATEAPPRISVSFFDYSVENHLKSLRTMFKLCGEHATPPDFNQAEIQHLSSITFLKEWRDFNYKPKTIRFACQNQSMNTENVIAQITLPQFSSVAVPQDLNSEKSISSQPRKDVVVYVGGSVWALDWCPRSNQQSVSGMKMEFVAVAAHPPGSSYHKIGSALTGRGVVQIWCILDASIEESNSSQGRKKQKCCYRKRQSDNSNPDAAKKPRGRPKKHRTNDTSDNIKNGSHVVDSPTIHCPKDSSSLVSNEIASKDTYEGDSVKKSEDVPAHVQKRKKRVNQKGQTDGLNSSAATKTRESQRRKARNEALDKVSNGSPLVDPHAIQCPGVVLTSLSIDVAPICKDGIINAESEITQSQVEKNQEGNARKCQTESIRPQMTRERSKTKSGNDSSNDIERSSQCIQPLEFGTIPVGGVGSEHVAEADNRSSPPLTSGHTECKLLPNSLKQKRLKVKARIGKRGHGHNLVQDGERELTPLHSKTNPSCVPDSIRSSRNVNSTSYRDVNTLSNYTSSDHVPLPRMMLCLAHNGKVVWDLKWQPSNSHDKLRLGYLAVVLGSGSIEVWEVPCPYAVQVIYNSSSQLECTDPRFIKLQPVFKCSNLNWGDKQSIPLTIGWSTSSPHDMVVAGCHDGVVALFKFSAAVSCKDTKPLLCFNADTGPIRTLAWAPAESDASNVIVTSGYKGLKFWDIRDPFHPLWDFHPVRSDILSLDWLPDPRCVVVSFDDGTLRVLSLMKAANDVPVTGKPFSGTPQKGFSSYFCSSFAIWDVHVSRKTGIVAYCGVDGNTLRFQLTTRAVEKDAFRNRDPHFLCGSLKEEESEFTVITSQHDTPFPMKKSLNEWGDAPRTSRGFLAVSNQEKRAKEEMEKNKISDERPLALCYGNDPGGKFDTDPLVSPKTKQAHDPAIRRTSKADEKSLTCINENPEMPQNAAEQQHDVDEIDSFPLKSIAIHRVRWNMNKGSERWLCYGGAAGIVRLQKVNTSIY